jgi:hypothetical protein
MNRSSNELYDKDQISRIWSEAYRDWVSDWEDTVNKYGNSSVACCGGVPSEKRILWPIDRP